MCVEHRVSFILDGSDKSAKKLQRLMYEIGFQPGHRIWYRRKRNTSLGGTQLSFDVNVPKKPTKYTKEDHWGHLAIQ